ncbi:hypothetical protein [Siphonobacter sp. SORGH_AS_1065]|uniref:hypothetical protein n=1 Tax=Siphonobacter sp. SORGH_AS_1065 TaxID=3041795 RepID=UPI00277E6483|nr:hypothetical protein [Siphonobacter sp. SORGH_AS_1065]MDQ1085607.1 hypothetical protein [Siphonobacter sp. SORGH_AS_1065]
MYTANSTLRTLAPPAKRSWASLGLSLYVGLLLFEGALRKWILPGLASPLLLIRDPLALVLVVAYWPRQLRSVVFYVIGMLLIGSLGIVTALLFGHGNLAVALFGARVWLIHFPLMFIFGQEWNRSDILKIGRWLLILSIPMTLLIAWQFYSPQTAWVNRGVGGDMKGSGFSGALGFFRPSATFSFTNGTTHFYGFIAGFIFYFWLSIREINRWLLIAATLALLVAIPLSISRALFFQVLITLGFTVVIVLRLPQKGKYLLVIAGVIVILGLALSYLPFFNTAMEAFNSRFVSATESEGGMKGVLGDRYLGGMFHSLLMMESIPFWGYGQGIGTSVGGVLLSGKQTMLIYSEDEWARLIGELGPLLGLAGIFIRLLFSVKLAQMSFVKLGQQDLLPWSLLSFFLLNIPQGQWGQPTSLGFSVVSGGMLLACLKKSPNRERNRTDLP